MRFTTLFAAALLTTGLNSFAIAKTDIVVLPRDYAGDKELLLRQFATMVTALGPNDRLKVYAAPGTELIATIAIPDDPKVKNPSYLKRRLGEQFRPVLRYISALPLAPADGTAPQDLMIPDLLDDIGRNVVPATPEKSANILLIGSWLYVDRRDDKWNMVDRFFPSDFHLRVAASDSPYGVAGMDTRLAGATIHFCWPQGETAFVTQEYEEAVRRFWTIRTVAQGGRVGTFGFDLPTCVDRFLAGEASGQATYDVSQESGKLEMLRVAPAVPATLPATTERPGSYFLRDDVVISQTPPTATTGIAWVGIKWDAPCDIDVYARGDTSNEWLFFGQVRTSEGNFNKDYREATGQKQFEYIEFIKPIDLTKAELAINFYSGSLATEPEGVLRVWFAGAIYEAPFKLKATSGNQGAPPMTGSRWLKIDLRDVVGLRH